MKKQTSVRYKTWEAEESKKSESRDGATIFAGSEQIVLNFAIVVLSAKKRKKG
jgi:hypothetical protein